jgi:general secretion pathway protein D
MLRLFVLVFFLMFGAMLPSATVAQGNVSVLNDYEGADIRAFIRMIAAQTGRTFVIDPGVGNKKITIIAPPDANLTDAEVWELFLATMQINGFAVLPISEGEYKIIPSELATRSASTNGTPAGGEFVTRVVRVDYVDVRAVANALKGLHSQRGIVTPILDSNSLVIVDTAANVSRMLAVIDRTDRDTAVVKSIKLQNAYASDVASVLSDLVRRNGEGLSGVGTDVVAVDSSNTIILRGNPKELARLEPIVRDLDLAGNAKVDFSVLRLNHADAEEIVPLLQDMIDGSYGTESAARKPSIVFHKQTNSLIINADADTQRVIQSVVRQLDIRRPQVLIEAIIVDISDQVVRDLGLQYIISGDGDNSAVPFTSTSFTNTQPNILATAASAFLLGEDGQDVPGRETIIDAAVSSLLGINGGVLGGGGQSGDGTLFAAILTAIQTDTDSNILSTPFAITLDNQTARLQVGQEIPVTSGEALGADLNNTFRQVERKEVGIILEVTPQISEGDTVRLDITQEISSINGALTALNSDIVTNKAVVTTSALADDQEILVLGGLIDDDIQITQNKVPVLGDIPGAGFLFRGTSSTNNKGTLMVFIKPTILRDKVTAAAATQRKYDYARRQQMIKQANEQPAIDLLVEEYLGVDPESLPTPNY